MNIWCCMVLVEITCVGSARRQCRGQIYRGIIIVYWNSQRLANAIALAEVFSSGQFLKRTCSLRTVLMVFAGVFVHERYYRVASLRPFTVKPTYCTFSRATNIIFPALPGTLRYVLHDGCRFSHSFKVCWRRISRSPKKKKEKQTTKKRNKREGAGFVVIVKRAFFFSSV